MNTIKKHFEEIVKLCEEKVEEYGERASFFMEPVKEETIQEWERENGITIPEDYKQWLRLTENCQMCSSIASLVFPETKQPDYLPEDYVLIGYVVGDGEVLCFSKSTGKYITYFEGKVNEEYDAFKEVLTEVIRMISGKRSVSEEEKQLMLEKLKQIREKKDKNAYPINA